eukprot:scaffold83946_cov36-Phaeocystis_antarctica.AAC.1
MLRAPRWSTRSSDTWQPSQAQDGQLRALADPRRDVRGASPGGRPGHHPSTQGTACARCLLDLHSERGRAAAGSAAADLRGQARRVADQFRGPHQGGDAGCGRARPAGEREEPRHGRGQAAQRVAHLRGAVGPHR